MFATTENAKKIAFIEADVVAKLRIEDTCRGFAGGRTRKVIHGRRQEDVCIDVSGQFDDLSAVGNGSESLVGVTGNYRHGMG